MESPGSTHGSTAFHLLNKLSHYWLFEQSTADERGRQFWLAPGDEAYASYQRLVSP